MNDEDRLYLKGLDKEGQDFLEAWWTKSGSPCRLEHKSYEVGPIDVGPAEAYSTVTYLIAAGAGVVSATIAGICAYLASKRNGKIVIHGSNNMSVEVPAGTRPEEIDLYIVRAKAMSSVVSVTVVDASWDRFEH
jgi:hypothetical protein